ncbi:MAG: argininosuccinate synthase [Planctomycetales bacterium]|nr:argininosuccinate synthase [Planctomycetales bacterium]
MAPPKKIVVAYSGGLDTTFCVVWLRKELSAEVHTVVVNTGGVSAADLDAIAARAREAGSASHRAVEGRRQVFDRFLSYLIKGNVLRGAVYPLCVGVERVVQAEETAQVARDLGADAVCHGSTGAGNDQVRFDVALRICAPNLEIVTPIRDLRWSRQKESDYLRAAGIAVAPKTTTYSVNTGLWGTTIGGGETHDPWKEPSADAWAAAGAGGSAPSPREVVLGFERGLPVSLDGERLAGVPLLERTASLATPYGIGRGIHLGETILGIKGRIGFVAAAAAVLVPAHRELEKLTLTRWQSFWKDHLAGFYGDLLHEGLYFEPAMRDIEALVDSSQQRVTGETRVRLRAGGAEVVGVRSPFALSDPEIATYGETPRAFSGEDARGFARIRALPALLWKRAGERAEKK